jgi:hypothetical protein
MISLTVKKIGREGPKAALTGGCWACFAGSGHLPFASSVHCGSNRGHSLHTGGAHRSSTAAQAAMAKPVPLGTLFELPLESFGGAAANENDITAAALQELELDGAVSLAAADSSVALPTAPLKPASPTCIACGIGVDGAPGFASAEEQRRHFSLDWHRYNVKRRAVGRERVSQDDFEALLEDERQEVGSISGSESEQSDGEDDEDAAPGLDSRAVGPQFAFTAAGAQDRIHLASTVGRPHTAPHSHGACRLAIQLAVQPVHTSASLPVTPCRRQALCCVAAAGGPRPRALSRPRAPAQPVPSLAEAPARAGRALGGDHAAGRPLCCSRLFCGPRSCGQHAPARQV